MTSANAARVFAPGAEAVARGSIPEGAIDVVRQEKVVVLVDDSISVRKFVGRMLEKAGYRVKLAADGLEALEIVTQTRCDLVVTDLEMPRTNGYELLNHLRQDAATRNLPVMVVTSRAGAKHRDRAMKDGAAAFMTKPVQEDQFITAVTKLIGPAADSVEGAGDRLQGVGDR
jgi:chemosensory pili system protein ChpA (sensor histidine kinase/response regulator)